MSSPKDWNQAIIDEFRANDGVVGGNFAKTPLLLLHTTGAKSGKARLNPVAYLEDGDRLVIIASKGGAATNPDWYHNLKANPEVRVEVGTEEFSAQAEIAEEPERTRLFEKMADRNPGFATYQSRTARTIPVVMLTRQN